MHKDWIQTFTGLKVRPLTPPKLFDVRDIARALSMQCRYAGHVSRFYSVAEHSCHVTDIVASRRQKCCPICVGRCEVLPKWALMHDAAEAFLGDVTRPLKHTPDLTGYRLAEQKMQLAITSWLKLPPLEPKLVSSVDKELLGTEAAQLKYPIHKDWTKTVPGGLPPPIPGFRRMGWTPARAEREFLARFHRLFPNQR